MVPSCRLRRAFNNNEKHDLMESTTETIAGIFIKSTIPVIHNARIFYVAERGGTRPKVHLR